MFLISYARLTLRWGVQQENDLESRAHLFDYDDEVRVLSTDGSHASQRWQSRRGRSTTAMAAIDELGGLVPSQRQGVPPPVINPWS